MLPQRMNRLLLIVATILVPLHGSAQSSDILPAEIAPGVPKTDMMAAWLKQQALAALDRRDAAFEKLTDDQFADWQRERRDFFRRQIGPFPERMPLNAKVTGRIEMDGGLDPDTLPRCAAAGADTLVAGSAIFGAPDMRARIAELRAAKVEPHSPPPAVELFEGTSESSG